MESKEAMLAHLQARFFDPSKYPNVSVTAKMVTLPLFNLSHRMVGYQTYRPELPKQNPADRSMERYAPYVSKPTASTNAELAVWGLETVTWFDQFVFLTEGVFDACRLHWHGLPALALLSCNPLHLQSWLKTLPMTKVACVQGDKAGQKLAKFGDLSVFLPEGEDVGSLTETAFLETFGRWMK